MCRFGPQFYLFSVLFLFSVKTEEISIIIAIAVVISILYSQSSSIILKNQSLVISYISGGIPYRHVVSVNQIENIHIYYKTNLSAIQIGNYFISVQYFDRKL